LKCLRHIVISGGFRTIDPSRVEAITNVNDIVQTKDQVHTFIGLMGYNRGYIPQLASRIAPLHDLLREGYSMNEWKDKVHDQIVRNVKKLLSSRPLLKLPDPRRKYYIHVDAFIEKGRGLGATLLQEYTTPPPDPNFIRRTNKHKEGRLLKAIEYWSRLLTDREREYSATKCEALSLHEPSCIGPPNLTTVFHSLLLLII
jgi:hypothetical protein